MLGSSLLGGATASIIITPSIACVTHWFFRRRGLALGLATTAGGFSCVLLLKTILPPKKAGARVDLKTLREIPFTTLSIAIILVDFALLVPLTYIPSYAITCGMDSSLAYQLDSILNGAATVFVSQRLAGGLESMGGRGG